VHPVTAIQNEYSLMERAPEMEIQIKVVGERAAPGTLAQAGVEARAKE
jgi:hypothetical protein